MSKRPEFVWPLYFAARELNGKTMQLRKGQLFPVQEKRAIRGLARAYGVENGDGRPFAELDYVVVLDVGNSHMAQRITDEGLGLNAAKKALGK